MNGYIHSHSLLRNRSDVPGNAADALGAVATDLFATSDEFVATVLYESYAGNNCISLMRCIELSDGLARPDGRVEILQYLSIFVTHRHDRQYLCCVN